MEADSIMKSARHADSTLSLGDLDSGAAGNRVSDAGIGKAAPVLNQQKAVGGSLDHIAGNLVTAAKSDAITDPEQAHTQGTRRALPLCAGPLLMQWSGQLQLGCVDSVMLRYLVHPL